MQFVDVVSESYDWLNSQGGSCKDCRYLWPWCFGSDRHDIGASGRFADKLTRESAVMMVISKMVATYTYARFDRVLVFLVIFHGLHELFRF